MPSAAGQTLHPYFPVDAAIVDYVPNTYSAPALLGIFATIAGTILGSTYIGIRNFAPSAKRTDRFIALWFVLCGCLHLFFEGYFVLNYRRLASTNNLLAQLWKEYALSDSRYLSGDPYVLCLETITVVVWGPLSLTVAYLITIEHPLRHPLQAIVSVGHLYSDTLYYATSFFDLYYTNVSHCRPEGYYFWVYFFIMNAFWIVIPGILLYQSCSATARAFKALHKLATTLQANGHVISNRTPKTVGSAKKVE